MLEFFANLYEWFGLIPLYSKDLGDHLRGFDLTCSDYTDTPLYAYIGIVMIISVLFFYVLQYHIINSASFNKRFHWWLIALTIAVINFLIALLPPLNDRLAEEYCKDLNISTVDCIGFGISNALWGFLLFVLITSIPVPRRWAGANTTHTTFWKPKS